MTTREYRASLRRDTQEGSYCAQFKMYHDEMKENENKEPPVTADLARVAAVRCQCGNPKCPTNVASDIARELAAARAAIKVAREALESISKDDIFGVTMREIATFALAQLNTHTHE